jgi:hypothetical protein
MAAEPSMEAGDQTGGEGEEPSQPKAPHAVRQHSPSAGRVVVSASGGASTGSYTAIGWAAGRHSGTPPAASAHGSPPRVVDAASAHGQGDSDAERNPHRPTTLPSRPAGDGKGVRGDVSPARRAVLARSSGGGTGATGVNPSPRAGGFRD